MRKPHSGSTWHGEPRERRQDAPDEPGARLSLAGAEVVEDGQPGAVWLTTEDDHAAAIHVEDIACRSCTRDAPVVGRQDKVSRLLDAPPVERQRPVSTQQFRHRVAYRRLANRLLAGLVNHDRIWVVEAHKAFEIAVIEQALEQPRRILQVLYPDANGRIMLCHFVSPPTPALAVKVEPANSSAISGRVLGRGLPDWAASRPPSLARKARAHHTTPRAAGKHGCSTDASSTGKWRCSGPNRESLRPCSTSQE